MNPLVPELSWYRPQNRWNADQRLFLCCMMRFFERDKPAFSKIFSCSFEAELRQSGYQDGIGWAAIYKQWHAMRHSGDYLWGTVHLAPFTKEREGTWYPIIRKIKQIAQKLNLQLVEKDKDDIDTSNYYAQPPKALGYHDRITATENVRQEAQAEAERQLDQQTTSQETNKSDENQEAPILVTAGGKICLFCVHEGNMHSDLQSPMDEIPPLLYRWSNVDSQGVNSRRFFQAGLFAEGAEYIHPHEIPQAELNMFIENHVRIRKSLSPFISTFKMMLAPIHRALRNEEGAIVSIMDRKKLETPIYSAQAMVKTLNLKFGWYNGAAEYLIWGSIPKSAIICSFKASTLLRIAQENPEIEELLQFGTIKSFPRSGNALHQALTKGPGNLDYETGATIGKFLFKLEVPYEHCKRISYGMHCSWWMKRNGSLDEFYRGLENGYYSLDQRLTPPTVMVNSADAEMSDDMSEISEFSESFDDALAPEPAEIFNIPEDLGIPDDISEMSEVSEFLGNAQSSEAIETSNLSDGYQMVELPVRSRTPQFSAMSDISDMSAITDFFDTEWPSVPEAADHQSDEGTVTNDDPRSSIILFSEAGSPPGHASAVVKLFDGATKQWIAQQQNKDDLSSCGPPGSSAHTAISIDSDDEFDQVFGQCKVESSMFSSLPPDLELERIVPKTTIVNSIKAEEILDPLTASQSSVPAAPTSHDRFAADRARVLHFWK